MAGWVVHGTLHPDGLVKLDLLFLIFGLFRSPITYRDF